MHRVYSVHHYANNRRSSLLKRQQKPKQSSFCMQYFCPVSIVVAHKIHTNCVFVISVHNQNASDYISIYKNIISYHFLLVFNTTTTTTTALTTTNQPLISDHQVNTLISDVIFKTNEKLRETIQTISFSV